MTARLVVVAAFLSGSAFAQGGPGDGSWSSTYDWLNQISIKNGSGGQLCVTNGHSNEREFSSAALIPTGYFAGSVIMWRKELVPDGSGGCKTSDNEVTWVFDPSIPFTLVELRQTLLSEYFLCRTIMGSAWPFGRCRRSP
jgi:hypothetical protein